MKQVWITRAGPPEVLAIREGPDPTPRSGEVRVRVEAAGVNFADILGRQGVYPDAPPIPYVPGYEVAGVVDSVGQGVAGLKEGDRIMALSHFNGYSDVVCVSHKHAFHRLEWMKAEDGVALLLNYLTAYQALIVMGGLQSGQIVLIHNAGGGVGLAALDICKIVGAQAYGTASTGKHEFLLERGLSEAIDYRQQDYSLAVSELTSGRGVDVILDPLGGAHWRRNYELLAPAGRLIHYGASSVISGKRRSIWQMIKLSANLSFYTPLRLMKDNKAVAGVNLPLVWQHADLIRPWQEQIIAWYDEALFRPHVDRTFKLSQAAEAHHYLEDRKNIGKVVLVP
jgi:synaptic vesicle membrane protein VAT-1